MKNKPLEILLLEQANEPIWMVNRKLHLVYANKAYFELIPQESGFEKKLNAPILRDSFKEEFILKWKFYYKRALNGECYEVEEHFYLSETKEMEYISISFNPIRDDNNKISAVACQSRILKQSSKQQYEAKELIDASLDVYCTIDKDGVFVYVNKASKPHWGYTPEELVGKPYVNFIVEEDIPKSIAIAEEIIKGKKIRSFVNRYKRKDGGIAYNLWSVRWDENTKLNYCVARDAKEHLEKEEVIFQREQRFKALVNEGDDFIGILNEEEKYTYVSPTSFPILGIVPEEFLGKKFLTYVHSEDQERVSKSLQQIYTDKKVMIAPYRFRNGKNQWRWIETVLTNMLQNNAVKGIIANSRDITKKIAEQRQLKLLESVITNTEDAVLITEAEPLSEPGPRIIYVNEAFTKMTGYTAEEVIGKTPRILQGPNSDQDELNRLSKSLRKWESCEITTINYKKNGEEFWINFTVSPVANEKGWYTHWIAIERDVTEQKNKELEQELLRKISDDFSSKNNLHNSSRLLCETICNFGQFDSVELWLPNIQNKHFQLVGNKIATAQAESFYLIIDDHKSSIHGEGFIDKVLEKKTSLYLDDIVKNDGVNVESVKKAGLKSIVGIPLRFEEDIVGVLIITSQKELKTQKHRIKLFEQLVQFIGSELNRKQLEGNLKHLYNAIPDILCVVSFEGVILKMNNAGYELLGYPKEAVLHRNFADFTHPDDKDIAFQKLKNLRKSERIFNFENRYITKNEETIWLSWSCQLIVEEGLIYAAAKNITEEKKLRELNRQIRQLAKVGGWEYDLVNDQLFWSDEVHQLHETDPKTFVPNVATAINFYKKEHQPFVSELIQKGISEGTKLDYEAIIVTTTNEERWVRVVGIPEYIGDKCVKFIGSFQNFTERKEVELKLKESESKFRTIFEIATLGIAQVNATNGKINLVNSHYENITGYSKDELIKMSFKELTHPDDRKLDWELFSKAAKGELEYRNTKRYIRKDGKIIWVKLHVAFIRDENGNPLKTVAICEDITDQKRIENQKIFLQSTIEASLNEIYIFDAVTFNFSYVNKGALLNLGYSKKELNKLTPIDIKPKYTLTSFKELVVPLMNNEKKKIIFFTQHQRKDGSLYPIEAHLQLVEEGANKRFLAIVLDITARKTAEENLISTLDRLRLATDAAHVGVWDWDIIKNNLIWDKKMYEIFDVDPADFNGAYEAWASTIHPDDIEQANKDVENAIKGITEFDSNFRIILKDNTIHYIKANGLIQRNKKGEAIRMIGTNWDITKEKLAEKELVTLNNSLQNYAKELERSNEELEQFAFITSHDLQEPLRMITSFLSLLELKYKNELDDKATSYINYAKNGAKRMKQIIFDLLFYSRINRPTDQQVSIDINDIISEFLQLRKKLIDEKKAIISYTNLPTIKTYKAPVTQLFHCLLDNALKYSQDHIPPEISIEVLDKGDLYQFAIKDNGIGIDKKFHEKIFVIFQRLHNRDEFEGTGIGLSVAKRAVEFLGGKIWIKSFVGKGTTFYFTISKQSTKTV